MIRDYVRSARMPPTPSSSSWTEPVLDRAAVQPVGDVAQRLGVGLDVGVQQQQRHPADLGDPDLGEQRVVAGDVEDDLGVAAVGARAAG